MTPDIYSLIALALAALALAVGVGVLGGVGLLAAVVVLFVASALRGAVMARRMAARTLRDPRFVRTDEIFLDHASGKVMRVYADPATGERRYVKD
jgi:membrane protein implicated in regulation of membrane protease activity